MNFKPLDDYLDGLYKRNNIPGLGCVVYRYGKLLHEHCTGWANVEEKRRFASNTLINLYSASKVSTCLAGMRLAERGDVDLDAPVADYLPEMAHVTVAMEDGSAVPAKNTMLVRHLFSMSAGFSYDHDTPDFKKLLSETNGAPTTRQVIRVLAERPLLFEPGTRFRYSFCHDVLGAVLEVVRDKPLSGVLREEIFEPIGMSDTAFKLTDAQRARLAPEYHGFNGETGTADEVVFREGVDMGMGQRYESGGGGLMSCVSDYGLLTATLANGGTAPNGRRIVKPETIDLMRRNQMTPEGLTDFEAMGGWSKAGYGYGFGVRTLMNRERNNSLSCNGEFGWDGALGCYLLADPDSGIGLFYAQQERGSAWYTFHGTVRNFTYACILGSEE